MTIKDRIGAVCSRRGMGIVVGFTLLSTVFALLWIMLRPRPNAHIPPPDVHRLLLHESPVILIGVFLVWWCFFLMRPGDLADIGGLVGRLLRRRGDGSTASLEHAMAFAEEKVRRFRAGEALPLYRERFRTAPLGTWCTQPGSFSVVMNEYFICRLDGTGEFGQTGCFNAPRMEAQFRWEPVADYTIRLQVTALRYAEDDGPTAEDTAAWEEVRYEFVEGQGDDIGPDPRIWLRFLERPFPMCAEPALYCRGGGLDD